MGKLSDRKSAAGQSPVKLAENVLCLANGSYNHHHHISRLLPRPTPTPNVSIKATSKAMPTPINSQDHPHFQVSGNLVGPSTVPEWNDADEWLRFSNVDGLTVDGSGLVGGQGPMWWSCRTKPHITCNKPAPTALYFAYCNGLHLKDVRLFDNPRNHISLLGCNGAVLSNLFIKAPWDSPNTDGIDIQDMKDLQIYNSTIATGDDCIAILNNTFNVKISNVSCGPGHGISIGSLGKGGALAVVENVQVSDCMFIRTVNGARIKTWQDGIGFVRGITFENLLMYEVQNPIIIDQNYEPSSISVLMGCLVKKSGIRVSKVGFIGVRGTSTEQEAVKLICSVQAPCTNIVLSGVLMISAVPGEILTSQLSNAQGPACCNCNPPVFCSRKGL